MANEANLEPVVNAETLLRWERMLARALDGKCDPDRVRAVRLEVERAWTLLVRREAAGG
jgi:hypothetical protein